MTKDLILVGRFGAAHGVRGEVRLKSFTADPCTIGRYEPLLDETGRRRFDIEALRPLKDDLFVAKIAGVGDRNAAEALTNVGVFVPHASLPEPAAEEFYRADLVGLAVIDESGAPVGRIVDILDFGGGDILEIAPNAGGETFLLPFAKQFVPIVDLASGRVTIMRPVETEGEPSPRQGAVLPSPSGARRKARPVGGRN